MDHLRSVYSPILDLQNLEETFLARATQEYEARLSADNFVQSTCERTKKWGRTSKKDQEAMEREAGFAKYLNTLSIQLRLLSRTYQVTQVPSTLPNSSWPFKGYHGEIFFSGSCKKIFANARFRRRCVAAAAQRATRLQRVLQE